MEENDCSSTEPQATEPADHEPPGKTDGKRITWHTAFREAIKLELRQYRNALEFYEEHELTNEPLRIDVVIIKKKQNLHPTKPIAAIFRTWNLIEYKGPNDSLSVADFHKVVAYAHLYCSKVKPEAIQTVINDLTITFVTSIEPKKLKKYLREKCQYRLTVTEPGITLIQDAPLPMQIIERRRLKLSDNLWLASLGRDVSSDTLQYVLTEAKKVAKDDPISAYMYMLFKGNLQTIKEIVKMSDLAAFVETFQGMGFLEQLEAKAKAIGEALGEARGEARGEVKWKTAGKMEDAKNMLADGMQVEKVVKYTGLPLKEVLKLRQ